MVSFLALIISRGNVANMLEAGWDFWRYHFVANLLQSLPMHEFWTKNVYLLNNYNRKFIAYFIIFMQLTM